MSGGLSVKIVDRASLSAGSVSGREEIADVGAKPPERRRTRGSTELAEVRSRRIWLGLWRRIGVLEFIDYEARSFDYGEYAFAQDG
jgi:hypothetical protein